MFQDPFIDDRRSDDILPLDKLVPFQFVDNASQINNQCLDLDFQIQSFITAHMINCIVLVTDNKPYRWNKTSTLIYCESENKPYTS